MPACSAKYFFYRSGSFGLYHPLPPSAHPVRSESTDGHPPGLAGANADAFVQVQNEDMATADLSRTGSSAMASTAGFTKALFTVGHCSVIVLANTFTNLNQRYLNSNAKSGGDVILKKVCGTLML